MRTYQKPYQSVKDRESRRLHRNPLIQVPFTVWRYFETFILRTEYERRMRKRFALSRHSVERTLFSFNTRPVHPSRYLQGPRKPTLSNVAIYYLSMGLWFSRWPLSIIYYILFFPFICLVVARHQTVLMDEEVLQRHMQDGIRMLDRLPGDWDNNRLLQRARLLGGVNYKSSHDTELPVSEMEMGQSNFELPSIRREL